MTLEANGSTREALIDRLVHIGHEVRAELVRDDGERLDLQLPRDEAERLELAAGQIVYVEPTRTVSLGAAGLTSRRRGSSVCSSPEPGV